MRGEMLKKEFCLVHFGQIFVHDGPVGGGRWKSLINVPS